MARARQSLVTHFQDIGHGRSFHNVSIREWSFDVRGSPKIVRYPSSSLELRCNWKAKRHEYSGKKPFSLPVGMFIEHTGNATIYSVTSYFEFHHTV